MWETYDNRAQRREEMRQGAFLFDELDHNGADLVGEEDARQLMIGRIEEISNGFAMFGR